MDPECANWSNAAEAVGLEYGYYHVATDSQDGAGQAAYFDRVLRGFGVDPAVRLCALDREPNKPPMSPLHAEQFVCAWRAQYQRWPLYYRNLSNFLEDLRNPASPSLKNCPVWLAKYGDGSPHVEFFLWQYMGTNSSAGEWPSDEQAYPRSFAGLGKVDRSAYPGTRAELLAALSTVGA